MTDDAGNTASASTSFYLDTTADAEDDTVLAVSVDSVINDAESGYVTLTLSGVDGDAETVKVTLTDSGGTAVTAAAVAGNNGDWTVDVSGGALIDGDVAVSVAVVDDAGNTASASTSFYLDTTADVEDGIDLAVTVDSVINDEESGNVSLALSGLDPDVVSISVVLTDQSGDTYEASTYDEFWPPENWTADAQSLCRWFSYRKCNGLRCQREHLICIDKFHLDTAVIPPAELEVSAAHAMMTAEEAENAFTVSAESGASWTVTLTGSSYAAAQQALADAPDTVSGLQGDIDALTTIIQLEQAGLDTLQANVHAAMDNLTDAQAVMAAAQDAYDTARDLAVADFLTSYPDPSDLIAGTSTVEGSPISINGSLTLEVGSVWTQSDIDALQVVMDGFVSAYVPSGDTNTTVDDLAEMLTDASDQLTSAEAAVADADALLSAQAEVVAQSESALDGLEATLAATEADLQTQQADVNAKMVVKTGTGTGSAQVISLDAADLAALGDGQVTVESTATDLAGNTASASTSFDLDTTADAEDGMDLAVSVDTSGDGVINDAESGNVTLTLSGVDSGCGFCLGHIERRG